MLAHYLQLGLRSLRRNPMLTALMVMAIGFGVAASMITWSVFRVVSGNPIPDKSEALYTALIDNRGPQYNNAGNEPPEALDYDEAVALIRARKAAHQTLFYNIGLSVMPEGSHDLPLNASGYATNTDFFNMFEVPFQYGGAWTAADDDARAAVAIISSDLNNKLFGGANSVGREVTFDQHTYRIIGVTGHWDPKPRYFDVFAGMTYAEPPDVYIPFTRAIDLKIDTSGRNNCGGAPVHIESAEAWLHRQCAWIPVWVELSTKADAQRYLDFLTAYAAEQQRAGHFNWPPNVRLRSVMNWLDFEHVVPPESRISLFVSVGFFVICMVNTIGLLLAKFMRRSAEIGVRRALGATRREVYEQFLMEAATVGLAGGMLGLILTAIGMQGVSLLFEPEIARLAHLDFSLLVMAIGVAVLAALIAAFYPSWRAAQVQPAWQLKSN
ncbi:ABC transporter permease [Dyella choica]|uniref:FtsX-like permease family protein n=1 Tax=Dyella choica TaxID=1927959 RepID=A0A3S0WTM0_9GAMM|nr:ABC transporter permease [Dyella choica]RUL71484.1 FtsX-like permease family protein [Dyella choica]